jgi:hypothetical protein
MIDTDLEERLIVLPVERRDRTFTVLSTCACIGICLIVAGILYIGYLFDKKIWI